MTTEFLNNLNNYIQLLPLFFEAAIVAFLIAPFLGRIAKLVGAVDLPAKKRKRGDKTTQQRIHKVAKPRLGGVSYVLTFMLFALIFVDHSPRLYGLLIGIAVLTIVGIIDDIYELPGKIQFPAHVLAAVLVVITGTTIPSLQVAGQFINLSLWSTEISLLGLHYNFLFPADLITIGWIVTLINALNWVGGIDALEESVSFIACITLMFLGVKIGSPEIVILSVILAGSVFGFIPYNFPPSKIFSGTAGDVVLGFTIAVLSIQVGGKIPTAVLILIIPLIDMFWVLIGRLRRNKVKNPFHLLAISDRSHLHHRLLDLGFNEKQVLFLESTAIIILSTCAFYLSDLKKLFFVGIFASIILILFSIISLRMRSRTKKLAERNKELAEAASKMPPPDEPTPESKYAY